MATQHGNLSSAERATSAALGVGLTLIAVSHGSAVLRFLSGIIAGGLFARAAAGHCAVKSALRGHTTLAQGAKDQWRSVAEAARARADGLPGSPAHAGKSAAVDQSVDESFPASDPPASRLPDEPPSNAEAKWAAARAAGKAPK
jgi:hypothetical protein